MIEVNSCFLDSIAKKHHLTYQYLGRRIKGTLECIYYNEEYDMVLLNRNKELQFDAFLQAYIDRTGIEASQNKVILDSFFPFATKHNSVVILACGLLLLTERLVSKFPNRHFVLVGSADGRYSSMRFHTLRDNESWLHDNLGKYSQPIIKIML